MKKKIAILKNEELLTLKGGEILNKNSVSGCECHYKDTGVTNENAVSSCSCICMSPK